MKVEVSGNRVTVTRSLEDLRVRTESHFWFRLREEMRRRESDRRWVKVREPGALSSMPYALRHGPMRRVNSMVIDSDYAIRCPAEQYNSFGEVELQLIAAETV